MQKNRMFILAFVLLLVTASAIGGWIVGSNAVSPAEAAARTAPPAPSPILVPVESRVLSTNIITRGTARFGLPQSVVVVPSSLKDGNRIITSLPTVGTQLAEGDLLLTISGRPVFILQGDTPVFRDFVIGLVGDDVLQLEEALDRLGFNPGEVDGLYDEGTADAVAAWYEAMNWQVFPLSSEQQAYIQQLEYDLAVAESALATATAKAENANLNIDAVRANAETENLAAAANLAVIVAERDSVFADAESTQAQRESAEAQVTAAEAALISVELNGNVAIETAIDEHASAQSDAEIATVLVEQIQLELDHARQSLVVSLPADEIVFLPNIPVRVDQLALEIGDEPQGTLLTVTNNQLAIDSSLPLDEAPLVHEGMTVTIDEASLGVNATGSVSMVADSPGTLGVDGFHVYFEVMVDDTEQTLEGFSLRLTIPIESTGGEVIAVPISALSLAADGTSRVQVESEGVFEFITVEPGLAADGFVEVIPIDGDLEVGQMLVIGFE